MASALEKYETLGIRESLCISYRYPFACRELAAILRLGYSQSPKPLQSLLLQHTIAAFRLLPQMQTQSAVSAANLLSQSAEAALPKQKRGLAATEFKQAKVAYKRRVKTQLGKEDPIVQLPQDVLVHLFSFLDLQSLVSAGMVCRSWNAAVIDNYLWQFHYNTHFGGSESIMKMGLQGGNTAEDRQHSAFNGVCEDANYNWKDAFRRAYLGLPSWRYKCYRGYCSRCNSIVWLSNLKCPNKHSRRGSGDKQLKHISPSQVVRYTLDETSSWLISINAVDSDDDSETEEDHGLKFWTYIRR